MALTWPVDGNEAMIPVSSPEKENFEKKSTNLGITMACRRMSYSRCTTY